MSRIDIAACLVGSRNLMEKKKQPTNHTLLLHIIIAYYPFAMRPTIIWQPRVFTHSKKCFLSPALMNNITKDLMLRILTTSQFAVLSAIHGEALKKLGWTVQTSMIVRQKTQSVQWKHMGCWVKKTRKSKSKFKAKLIFFFDIKGMIMYDWVPHGVRVN